MYKRQDEHGRPDFNSMMTEGLNLTERLIAACSPEPDTCFVAMPFHHPYPSYYHEIYRKLLNAHGLTCVRAWGGLRNEAHHGMLMTLIDRCGWLFAELTDANPNVTFELGFATGRGKPTLMVMDTNPEAWVSWRVPGRPRVLSNLQGIAVFPYDSTDQAWRDDILNGFGSRYVHVIKKIHADRGNSRPAKRSRLRSLLLHLLGKARGQG